MNIVGSDDISILDFKVTYDLSAIPPVVKLENLSSGPHLGDCTWWYEILTPSGAVIHRGSEGSPDKTGTWAPFTATGTWPQPYGQIEFSAAAYKTTLYVKDSDGHIYSLAKEAFICRPKGNMPNSGNNLGVAEAFSKMRCDQSKLYVEDKTNYIYKGITPVNISRNYTLVYPQDPTGTVPSPFVVNGTSNALLDVNFNADGYTLYQTTVMNYNLGDGNYVQIKYKNKSLFAVRCNIDLGPLMCDYQRLIDDAVKEGCVTTNDIEKKDKLLIIGNYIGMAHIGVTQPLLGIDVPGLIEKIKELGNFTCDCYSPGTGINGSSDSNITLTVDATCGDLDIVSVTHVGNNWTITMKDKSYVMMMDADNNVAINAIFGITSTDDTDTCTKTYELSINKTNLDNYITAIVNAAIAGYTSPCCPKFINVIDHATNNAPTVCPSPFFPANIWDYTRSAYIGVADNADEMVGLMNADASWSAKGQAFVVDNCHVGFFPANGVTTINPVHIDLVHVTGGCGEDNAKGYLIGITTCDGSTWSGNYGAYVQMKYTAGGAKISLGWIANYSDLVAKLNAEPSKPVAITYYPLGNQSLVGVDDANCSANYQIQNLIFTEVSEIIYGANHHTGGATGPAMEVLNMHEAARIGQVCGLPNNKIPWHVFRIGDRLYTVESDTGVLRVINFANPLYPTIMATVTLAQTTGPEFTGLPKYGGTVFSHWDVYFPTDRDYNFDGFIYIMESTTGTIWKMSYATNTVTASFNDAKLIGACPRVLVNNRLYFSNDGDRAALTGQTAGIPVGKILRLNLSDFTSTGLTLFDCGNAGMYVWSISHGYVVGSFVYMVWVSQDGSIGVIDPVTDTLVGAVSTGVLGVVGGFTGLTNSTLYANKIYVSSIGKGTRVFNLSAPGETVYLLEAPGNNLNHYNFLPEKGACYGFLTYDASPAGVAVVSLSDGKLLGQVVLPSGDIYNVQPQTRMFAADPVTPNSICP